MFLNCSIFLYSKAAVLGLEIGCFEVGNRLFCRSTKLKGERLK